MPALTGVKMNIPARTVRIIWLTLLCLAMALSIPGVLEADPMHVAVRSLDIKMFNRLIEGQPDLIATDTAGMTALHHACSLGAVDMVRALLEKGALASQTSNEGNNAMHYAVNMGAICLDPEPPRSSVTICPLTVPALLASAGVDVNLTNRNGDAPLHIAARNGLVGVIATLLQSGANPNIRNAADETPLHLVGGPLPHIAAQVLLLHGGDRDAVASDGTRPLDRAKTLGNLLLINMLIQYDAKNPR